MKTLSEVIEKSAQVFPGHIQIQAAHLVQKAKRKLGRSRPVAVFTESPIADIDTLSIDDIDVSNPFLFRQNQWQSYFKRLRDECPVHYQKTSAFGPFWSITRYQDIMFVDKNPYQSSIYSKLFLGGAEMPPLLVTCLNTKAAREATNTITLIKYRNQKKPPPLVLDSTKPTFICLTSTLLSESKS
jgi:hypothetical protein